MEVRPGYKKTEVGMIPEDWQVARLNDLIDPSRGVRYGIVQPGNYDPKGRYMVRGQDYSRGWVEQSQLFRVTPSVEEPFKNARIKTGDILITIVGASTVRIATVPRWLDGANLTQTTARLAIDPSMASNSYCGHVLSSWYGSRQVENYIKGGAQPGLNCCDIERFLIPLPPTKTEQEAIAGALSDADTLIESLEHLIVKKRHLKQGAMQELLTGKKRLPGFSPGDGAWRQTKFGMIPEDWEPTPLESVAAFITKGSTPTTYGFAWRNEGVLFLRSECVSERGLELSQSMFIAQEAHQILRRSEVRDGDILMTITGNVGIVVHLASGFGEANINQHIARIRIVDEQVAAPFVFHFLSQPVVRRYYNLITTGQAYPQISLTQVRQTEVPMPTFTEQTAIAALLSDMDAEIAALEAKLAKYRQLKQGMMHNLLTGRIRLI